MIYQICFFELEGAMCPRISHHLFHWLLDIKEVPVPSELHKIGI
jgi:hypothetical protein